MRAYGENSSTCWRHLLFKELVYYTQAYDANVAGCKCCDICANGCDCDDCE